MTTFYLIRIFHIRNSSHRHSIRTSHIWNSSSFNIPPGCLTSGIMFGQRSTFSGYLTSGILSGWRLTFFFIVRAFSLGSKITFLIKLCCHFYFRQAIFILPLFFKMFWNKQGIKFSNSEQWSYRNWFRQDKTCFGGGPTYEIGLAWLSYIIDLSCSLICMQLFLNCALTSLLDSALWITA